MPSVLHESCASRRSAMRPSIHRPEQSSPGTLTAATRADLAPGWFNLLSTESANKSWPLAAALIASPDPGSDGHPACDGERLPKAPDQISSTDPPQPHTGAGDLRHVTLGKPATHRQAECGGNPCRHHCRGTSHPRYSNPTHPRQCQQRGRLSEANTDTLTDADRDADADTRANTDANAVTGVRQRHRRGKRDLRRRQHA